MGYLKKQNLYFTKSPFNRIIINMEIKYLPIDWQKYHKLAQKLANKIFAKHVHVDEIVAIARGGLTLGHLLSDLIKVPISVITIQSYTDLQTQGIVNLTTKLQSSIRNKKILLVDDVADSGKTLQRAISYLKKSNPETITTVTMFFKPSSVYQPDIFAQKTTKWILFPYEPTEMIELITQKMAHHGENRIKIRTFLENLGYTDNQINFTYRYHSK